MCCVRMNDEFYLLQLCTPETKKIKSTDFANPVGGDGIIPLARSIWLPRSDWDWESLRLLPGPKSRIFVETSDFPREYSKHIMSLPFACAIAFACILFRWEMQLKICNPQRTILWKCIFLNVTISGKWLAWNSHRFEPRQPKMQRELIAWNFREFYGPHKAGKRL